MRIIAELKEIESNGGVRQTFQERYGNLSDTIFLGDIDLENMSLTSLKGSPRFISGNFNCSVNSLKNLIGGPIFIGGDFDCSYNSLRNLIGGPQIINGNYNCSVNKLLTLRGAPISLGGNMDCLYNLEVAELGSMAVIDKEYFSKVQLDIFEDGGAERFLEICRKLNFNYKKVKRFLDLL